MLRSHTAQRTQRSACRLKKVVVATKWQRDSSSTRSFQGKSDAWPAAPAAQGFSPATRSVAQGGSLVTIDGLSRPSSVYCNIRSISVSDSPPGERFGRICPGMHFRSAGLRRRHDYIIQPLGTSASLDLAQFFRTRAPREQQGT